MPFIRSSLAAAAVVGISLTISGCGGSDVTMYEPGVYQGKQDATASQEAAEARAEDLRNRAQTGFADR